jgi:hypothetical protein
MTLLVFLNLGHPSQSSENDQENQDQKQYAATAESILMGIPAGKSAAKGAQDQQND